MIEVYNELKHQTSNYSNILSFLKNEITNTSKIQSINLLRNSFKRITQLFIILDNRIPEKNVAVSNNKRKLNAKRSFNHCPVNKSQTDSIHSKHSKSKVFCDTKKLFSKPQRRLTISLAKIQEKLKINKQTPNESQLNRTLRQPKVYSSIISNELSNKVRQSKIIYPIFNNFELMIGHKDADRIRKQDKQILIVENIFNQGNISAKTISLAMQKIWKIEHELNIINQSLILFQEIQMRNLDLNEILDSICVNSESFDNTNSSITKQIKYHILCNLGSSIKYIRNFQTHIAKYVVILNDRRNADRILLYLRRRDTRKSLMKIIEMERRNIRKDIVILCQSQLKE